MGLTGKLCLVFMAFCMQLCYLKDRPWEAGKISDHKPGISQPPDCCENVTHHLMFTYGLPEVSRIYILHHCLWSLIDTLQCI